MKSDKTVPIVLILVLAVLAGGFLVHSFLEKRAKKAASEAAQQQQQQIDQWTQAEISQLVMRTNAIDDWIQSLTKGDQGRVAPILTVELERLWLSDRPILFVGAIKDIATKDSDTSRVDVEFGLFNRFRYTLSTQLELSLDYPHAVTNEFLRQHPDLFATSGLNNGVAVAAAINEIVTQTAPGAEGQHHDIKIGKGKCLDMVFIGDYESRHWKVK